EDWGERAPTLHFVLDQDRLQLMGLTPREAGEQIQFLLTGVPVTQVREDIRAVDIVARTLGTSRFNPNELMNMTLTSRDGRAVPIAQVGTAVVREEDPILKRRDRLPTITVQCDIDDALQPPAVTMELAKLFKPITDQLPAAYSVEIGANVEEAAQRNTPPAAGAPLHRRLSAGGRGSPGTC